MKGEVGNHVKLADEVITDCIRDIGREKAWRDAAEHYLGAGLDTGIPSLGPARRAPRRLLKEANWLEVKALDRAICGAAWHHGREGVMRKCKGCGAEAADWHRYWSCEKLRAHEK